MELIIRKSANWIGTLIATIALIYVGYQFDNYSSEVNFQRFNKQEFFYFFTLAVLYGASNIFLTLSWRSILSFLLSPVFFRQAIRIFGLSQLAKYLPGNIFHLAGRQAMGMAQGISGVILLQSAIWEFGLIALVGSLFGLLILPLFFDEIKSLVAISLFVSGMTFLAWATFRFFGKSIFLACVYYFIFLSLSGLIFFMLINIVSENYNTKDYYIIAAFVISWLIGLVTPGAPAGIGIREVILLFLLKGILVEGDILIAIILGRLVTVVGDVFFYIYALFFSRVNEK